MSIKGRDRKAIHSGIGDGNHLLIKQPQTENVTEEFKYAARLKGKKRHQSMIYPEVPFQYGVRYEGETLETFNEKPYTFELNAHPEKVIGYEIEQRKELPFKRLWEAEACFEAEVKRWNMKYAFNYKAHKGKADKRTLDYAVKWGAVYQKSNHGDLKDYCTTAKGLPVGNAGYGNWTSSSAYIQDKTNTNYWSGVIAKDFTRLKSAEVIYRFTPIKSTTPSAQNVKRRINGKFVTSPGFDDDVIGFIFKAKNADDFYMFLWEGEERLWKNSRSPNNMENLKVRYTSQSDDTFVSRQIAEPSTLPNNVEPTASAWNNFVGNVGWKKQHRRLYRVKDGKMKRVDKNNPNRPGGTEGYQAGCYDKGNGAGWVIDRESAVKISMINKKCKISVKATLSGSWEDIYEFDTDWADGSFGVVNISQAVQFGQVSVVENEGLEGRIPETGWDSTDSPNKLVAGSAHSYVVNSDSFKDAKKNANVGSNPVTILSITGETKNASNGSITVNGLNGSIVAKANDFTDLVESSGRIPATGWFEFDGIGEFVHAPNAQKYIRDHVNDQEMALDSITGIVEDPASGSIVVSAMTGPLIAKNNNPKDAGEIYKKCYIRCGIVEITPDMKNYATGLMVFDDIANVFKEDYAEFFNRDDYINKKAVYKLLQPAGKEVGEDEDNSSSQAGCVIEDEPEDSDEEVIECVSDFDFDEKKLVMWGCKFEIDLLKKLFEDGVFAYEGWKVFDPLAKFVPNKWTTYTLMPVEGTVNPEYDEIIWDGWNKPDKSPVGTKVKIKTKEWYRAVFSVDSSNKGIVTSEKDIVIEMPTMPEHYFHPERKDERMPGNYEKVRYLLDAFTNYPDVVMWYEKNPDLTTENVSKKSEHAAVEGRKGIPIIIAEDDTDKVIIHCKENPVYTPWNSGKYIGVGKVNGKRPFFGDGSGKADMTNVSTAVVFFPNNLVMETLKGPFIDVYDVEFPDYPRIKYKVHSDGKYVDFYSDHTDAYIWFTDWYSKWVRNEEDVFSANMTELTVVDVPLDLDPTNPLVSDDYNPDDTVIENIEVSGNNPFVKIWIEEDKGRKNGLLGTYYRMPLSSDVYKESFPIYEGISNVLQLEKNLGTYMEVYLDGVLLEDTKYSISQRMLTIPNELLKDKNWLQVQSYQINDFYDPTKKYYLGEKKYSQLDFQEDVPSIALNANFNDEFYEGSFCFNWKYERPIGMEDEKVNTLELRNTPEPIIPNLEPPKESNPNDGFSISWIGYIFAPTSGVYRFKATANDGFRLWIQNKEIINEWHTTGDPDYFPDYEASIYLEGGKWHPLRADYFDNVGQALIRLHWAMPEKNFQRISPDYLTPYLGYKLFAQVKKARPMPWSPMIHNGYYYHEEREHYLFADKIIHQATPNKNHQIMLSPRPQQGSAIIVRDNKGNNLRKVTFYDEDWNLTLENKEEFSGNGYAKYYLNYKGLDNNTLKVKLNGKLLDKKDYFFNSDESWVEFMKNLGPKDQVEVRYILLYSYYIEMNSDIVNDFVNSESSIITLHSNYDKANMSNMEIVYEQAKETPFYRAKEVKFNPLQTHNHTGFLYITEEEEQEKKYLEVHLSSKTLSNSGYEKVLLTAKVLDSFKNPCPNKKVEIWRDNIKQDVSFITNESGEVYFYDIPQPTGELISVYKVKCGSLIEEALLDYYVDEKVERYYLDMYAPKLAILSGVEDVASITVTLRDENWNHVGEGKAIKMEYRHSDGTKSTGTIITDSSGSVLIEVSGLDEKHGNTMLKISYDMGFEETANYIHLKVI